MDEPVECRNCGAMLATRFGLGTVMLTVLGCSSIEPPATIDPPAVQADTSPPSPQSQPPAFFDNVDWDTYWEPWSEHPLDTTADASILVYAKYTSPGAKLERDGILDVFLADRRNKSVTCISARAPSPRNSDHSYMPSISGD